VKLSASKCEAKFESVKKLLSYRLFNMTAYRFLALKMFKLKMLFNFPKLVTRYCRWRRSDVL